MSEPSTRVAVLTWVLALGGTGFAAGFFGPMILNPEANIGPIVGLLFTGPGGALTGLVLGAIFRVLPIPRRIELRVLQTLCAVLGIGTLYACLPEPAVRGYVIDAEVEDCSPLMHAADAALAQWEQAVARTTWATPPANWKQTALRNVQLDPGVVLTMRIARRSPIYRHRRPWDRGDTSAGPWEEVELTKTYYADDEGSACGAYLARPRAQYWPFSDATDPTGPPEYAPKSWPPVDTMGFLRLQALGPVPAEYARMLR